MARVDGVDPSEGKTVAERGKKKSLKAFDAVSVAKDRCL
jgi:hypothetical protein